MSRPVLLALAALGLTACTGGDTATPASDFIDSDSDGLTDAFEASIGTDPAVVDTDEDRLGDGDELRYYGTDPTLFDSDGDGIDDGTEVLDLGTDPADWDTDDDGTSEGDEVAAGTDPLDAAPLDGDGDGWEDGEENDAGTDPKNPFSWPHGTGRWPDFSELAVEDGLMSEGYGWGEVYPDFQVADQFGGTVNLYQFYGYVILLDYAAGWCGPCMDVAEGAQEMWLEYADEGFIIIHTMIEDQSYNQPSVSFLQGWSDLYGLEFPVTGGDNWIHSDAFSDLIGPGIFDGGIPAMVLLDRDMTISASYIGSGQDSEISRAIEDLL